MTTLRTASSAVKWGILGRQRARRRSQANSHPLKVVAAKPKPVIRVLAMHTLKELVVADQRNFAYEQERLKLKIRHFCEGGEARCTRHPHPSSAH